MADIDLLELLKISLEVDETYMDAEAIEKKNAELNQYLNSAQAFIATEGIDLDLTNYGDIQLVVMYAEWLYTKRRGLQRLTGANSVMGSQYPGPMPRALKRNLNNRLFSQKASADE